MRDAKDDELWRKNIKKEYGGYLNLELPLRECEYFSNIAEKDIVRLDCGRSAIWYALKIIQPEKVYVPYMNCPSSTDPIDMLGIPYEYYRLDYDLTPLHIEPNKKDALIWINYYGNATLEQIEKVEKLKRTTNLIVDNCHAFFSRPVAGAYNCYSARKFFGVCDGAYLIKEDIPQINLQEGESAKHMEFMLASIERGTNALYSQNLVNEARLGKETRYMSRLTKKILGSVDYVAVKERRKTNFLCLHDKLKVYNEFEVNLLSETHICYPLLVTDDELRGRIISRNIYTPTWWKHVPEYFDEDTLETRLSKYMLMLPIDQRYTKQDMEDIAEIVLEEYRRK